MSRIIAREHILKLLYQVEFHEEYSLDKMIQAYIEDRIEDNMDQVDIQFIKEEVEGTRKNLDKIDKIIETASKGWKLNRMSKIDLNILRLAIYEIKYVEDIPVNVAINEAVNLAKRYSGAHAPSFINGVLGNIVNPE